MARRPGGKLERRKARQRRVQRPATPQAPVAAPSPDADRAADTAAVAPEPPRRVTAPSATSAYSLSSTLSDRERAEYHYVERDLRNIGVLTVVLIGLLIGSWFLFNALGLIR